MTVCWAVVLRDAVLVTTECTLSEGGANGRGGPLFTLWLRTGAFESARSGDLEWGPLRTRLWPCIAGSSLAVSLLTLLRRTHPEPASRGIRTSKPAGRILCLHTDCFIMPLPVTDHMVDAPACTSTTPVLSASGFDSRTEFRGAAACDAGGNNCV